MCVNGAFTQAQLALQMALQHAAMFWSLRLDANESLKNSKFSDGILSATSLSRRHFAEVKQWTWIFAVCGHQHRCHSVSRPDLKKKKHWPTFARRWHCLVSCETVTDLFYCVTDSAWTPYYSHMRAHTHTHTQTRAITNAKLYIVMTSINKMRSDMIRWVNTWVHIQCMVKK